MSDDNHKIQKEETIDSEDQATVALKRVLRSEYAPPMSESVIDTFLSLPQPYPPEEVEDMHKDFIEKLFADVQPKGVRHLEQILPFERLLEISIDATRTGPQDVGHFIGKDASYVRQLIKGEVLLYEMPVRNAALLVKLLRIHYELVPLLIRASIAVRRGHAKMQKAFKEALKKKGKNIALRMKGQEGPDIELDTDLHYASLAGEIELSKEIESWMNNLRAELKQLGATDLLED
jgi:hypothetical protein